MGEHGETSGATPFVIEAGAPQRRAGWGLSRQIRDTLVQTPVGGSFVVPVRERTVNVAHYVARKLGMKVSIRKLAPSETRVFRVA